MAVKIGGEHFDMVPTPPLIGIKNANKSFSVRKKYHYKWYKTVKEKKKFFLIIKDFNFFKL